MLKPFWFLVNSIFLASPLDFSGHWVRPVCIVTDQVAGLKFVPVSIISLLTFNSRERVQHSPVSRLSFRCGRYRVNEPSRERWVSDWAKSGWFLSWGQGGTTSERSSALRGNYTDYTAKELWPDKRLLRFINQEFNGKIGVWLRNGTVKDWYRIGLYTLRN